MATPGARRHESAPLSLSGQFERLAVADRARLGLLIGQEPISHESLVAAQRR